MPTLVDFRRRIRSVQNTQKITRAMKLVSAAKLRRAQENVFNARPYAGQMQAVLKSLARRMEGPTHPLLEKREEKRILVLILSGDKGLCGPFNTNILRLADGFLARNTNGTAPGLITIGRRSTDYYRRRKKEIIAEHVDLFMRGVTHEDAQAISEKVIELYTAKEIDAVYVIYNEFKSVMRQEVVVEPLLPIVGLRFPEDKVTAREAARFIAEQQTGGSTRFLEGFEGIAGNIGTLSGIWSEGKQAAADAASLEPVELVDYLYDPDPETILATIMPGHVRVQVFRAMLESIAAEHAARMTAMANASRNADDLIDDLTLTMNKIRQEEITTEILEVVGGAEAQK
jgi:F-type H+-transporting ATPase subunit gamma